jgi:hypothetical protein
VRFFIVDDADDDDAQGRFFTTQDHAPEMNKLRSGSLWTAMHLEWLGVEYDPETVYLIDFSATDVSPALAERTIVCCRHADSGIELIRKGIEALDMDAVKARRVNFEALGWPAYYFDAAYKALVRVIQRPLELHPPAQPYNTPPRQTTVPANPNLSKESDMSTGSSASCESKPEPFTERFMDEFVTGVLASIQNQLAMPIPWLNKDDGFYLSMEYTPRSH